MIGRFLAISLCLVFPVAGQAKSVKVEIPSGAQPIISEYRSWKGVNGKRRPARHQGIDIRGPNKQPIIAAAAGKVVDTDVGKCWGPTITIDHGTGLDGKRVVIAYGHLGDMVVKKGQSVKRGQVIGRLGNNHRNFRCIGGVRHLHFQIGRAANLGNRKGYWGHVKYLKDGKRGVNPHLYWADGPGKVTCFRKGVSYPKGSLTYPVPCS